MLFLLFLLITVAYGEMSSNDVTKAIIYSSAYDCYLNYWKMLGNPFDQKIQ